PRWPSTGRCSAGRSRCQSRPRTQARRPPPRATAGGSRPRAPTRTRNPSPRDPAFLGHHDDVARLEEEVLVLPVRRDDLVVVEGDPLHPGSVEPEDEDSPASGEIVEWAGLGENVQHGGPALELVAAWGLDLTEHGDLEAPDFSDDDGNL